jgi:hypothetical protein
MSALCPHPQPLCLDAHKREETSRSMRRSQAWERGAGAGGEGGVRADFVIVTLIMSTYLVGEIDLHQCHGCRGWR